MRTVVITQRAVLVEETFVLELPCTLPDDDEIARLCAGAVPAESALLDGSSQARTITHVERMGTGEDAEEHRAESG